MAPSYMTPTFPEVVGQSVDFVWTSIILFAPRIFLAVLLFAVFLVIGVTLRAVVSRFITVVKLDALLAKAGVDVVLRRAGIMMHAGNFLGSLVHWFFVITGLLIASNLLGLT